jgi:photosynthetic reaction center H subunit
MSPVIVGNLDIAILSFYAFVLFFIGLVIYLNRESRREGFPTEDEMSGLVATPKLIDQTPPKAFAMPHGQGTRYAPPGDRDPRDLPLAKAWGGHGAPWVPTGNPLLDGVGPASFAQRDRRPDLDFEGHPRIVPIGCCTSLRVIERDPDPRGMTMIASDGRPAGTVTDIWVDRTDRLIRYLEVTLDGGRKVLAPMTMCKVKRRAGQVVTDSLAAHQFADAPGVASPETITLDEEERVVAYFGGGYLYSSPARSEPLL